MKLKTYRNIMLLAALIITAITLSQQPSNDAKASTQVVVSELEPLQIIMPEADWSQASEYCSSQIAANYISNGVDTRAELESLGISGRPYEIIDAHVTEQEQLAAEKAKREAAARAAARAATQRTVPATTSTSTAPMQGQWTGSHAEWDSIAIETLYGLGCNESQVNMMMYIHHKEGGPNSINWNNKSKDTDNMYGGWQLNYNIAIKEGLRWWHPVDSTTRAYRYVMGRYGSVEAAYNFKRSRGWY
jgi:hypothetical protein